MNEESQGFDTPTSQQSSDQSQLVDDVKSELEAIDSADLSEHAARFDALHSKLQSALNSIDGL